jgi:hypothetical protein
MTVVFTFHTTHHALWAEEIAQQERIAYEIVAPPPAARARCDIAIETFAEHLETFSAALQRAGVTFGVHGGP